MTDENVLTQKDEPMASVFRAFHECIKHIDLLMGTYHPPLNGERYLTDEELSQRIKVNRRTLHEYRSQGVLPYIRMGGKLLYRESDIETMMNANHRDVHH